MAFHRPLRLLEFLYHRQRKEEKTKGAAETKLGFNIEKPSSVENYLNLYENTNAGVFYAFKERHGVSNIAQDLQ